MTKMKKSLKYQDLKDLTLKEIYKYAREYKIPYYSKMNKKELIMSVLRAQDQSQGFLSVEGILDITGNDFGFLRPINYSPSQEDVYISASQINRFNLRNGDLVAGTARQPKKNESYLGLMHVYTVNGKNPEDAKDRPHFPALIPIYPDRQIRLETTADRLSTRIIDLIAPIGFGQRGLIAAPPKAGKTVLIKEIANAIAHNYPDTQIIVLLIDERPEEVTDMERSVDAEIVSSTFDQKPENHVRVAELVLERARRLVEDRRDVVILMDSITRLARAYNLVVPSSGKTLSGGLDPAAFHGPKRFFGSARNVEEGGSLTVLATALVETGSHMDDVIYEEFKGTGNMELCLNRKLAEKRVFPAIDIEQSGTRKEELLLDQKTLDVLWTWRRSLGKNDMENTVALIQALKQTASNEDFIAKLQEAIKGQNKN